VGVMHILDCLPILLLSISVFTFQFFFPLFSCWYEVKGPRPRGRPKRTWREVVEKDCQVHKLNKKDVMDRSRWRKLIKDVCDRDGC